MVRAHLEWWNGESSFNWWLSSLSQYIYRIFNVPVHIPLIILIELIHVL